MSNALNDVYRTRVATLTLGLALASVPLSSTAALTSEAKLGFTGAGPIVFGMTPAQAVATGTHFTTGAPAHGSTCYLMHPSAPSGLSFMIEGGNIRRADVTGTSVATTDGFRTGDPLAKVLAFYGARAEVTPAKYDPAGKTVTVMPKPGADTRGRFVFEIKDGTIHRIVSGLAPQVHYVEGCG